MRKLSAKAIHAITTGSLHATPDLQAVKQALDARTLTINPSAATTLASVLHQQGLTPVVKAAPAKQAAKVKLPQGALTTRRDTSALLPLDIGLPIATAPPLATSKTLGPFSGVTGPFWLDLHLPATTLRVIHASFADPVLVVTRGKLPLRGAATSIPLNGGSVWILARALASAAPEGVYVGFTISSGRIDFPRAPRVSGAKVTLGGALDLKLTTVPHDSRTTSVSGTAGAATQPPAQAVLTWTRGTVKANPGTGSATCYSHRFDFANGSDTFDWHSEIGSISLPFGKVTPDRFDAASIRSPIMRARGNAKVAGAWLLPGYHPANTDHWSEASGPGWWSLKPDGSLTSLWSGAPQAATLPDSRVIVDRNRFWLISLGAEAERMKYALSLWSENSARVPLDLQFADSFHYAFGSESAAGDTVTVGCISKIDNPRPIDVAGKPLSPGRLDNSILTLTAAGDGAPIIHVAGARGADASRRSVALRNALLTVAGPAAAWLEGASRNGRDIDSGNLRVSLPCYGWMPTLPDPYVSNVRPGKPASTPRLVEAELTWSKGSNPPDLSFHGVVHQPTATLGQTTPPAPTGTQQVPQVRVPTQVAQGRAHPFILKQPVLTHVVTPPDISASIRKTAAAEAKLAGTFKTIPPGTRGVRLLDVSGAKDLVGVGLDVSTPQGEVTFQLDKNSVVTPLSNVSAMMLPQVQWEPVRTLEIDQIQGEEFPSRLDFVDDGGPTSIMASTRTLVAAVPDLVVNAVLDAYSASPSTAVKVVTTLPFGLAARFELKTGRDDKIELVTPNFASRAVAGARQLKLVAGSPEGVEQSRFIKIDGERIGLTQMPGADFQTGRTMTDGPLPQTVATMLRNSFTDFVPLTRLDLAGYGASSFSKWRDPDALASIGKVQFQVLVGRTALEIVKAVSVLYPWGIIVTRTVTIERRGGGGVIRRDSGWQAASDGVFRFPPNHPGGSPYPFDVEPGLLRGLSAVHNIRDAGGAPIKFGSGDNQVTLIPIMFDAQAELAEAKLAGGRYKTLSVDAEAVLGLLQVTPQKRVLSQPELAQAFNLLTDPNTGDGGAVGGRIDAELNLADSNFRFRARRLEVAYRSASPQGLVGVVRGAPIFKQAGAWGVARRSVSASGDATEATSVEEARGTPVIATGKLDPRASTASGVSVAGSDGTPHAPQVGTFLFRDPADVYKQTSEARGEYGFLQSSPAHALFFPDPHLAPRNATRITSSSSPEFADAFLRTTTKGVFPSNAQSLVLPRLRLNVGDDGSLAPDRQIQNWAPGDLNRPLTENGLRHIEYSSATLSLTFGPSAWSVDLPGLFIGSDVMGIADALSFCGDIHAGTNRRAVLANLSSGFGGSLKDNLGKFAKWFAPQGKPRDLDLAATNAGVEGVLKFGFSKDLDLDPIEIGLEAHACFDMFNTSASLTPPGISLGLDVQGKIEYGIFDLLIGGSFEYEQSGTGENNFEVRAFVGFDVGVDKPPVFKFEYESKVGAVVTVESGSFGLGFFMSESIEIKITTIAEIIYVKAELELTCVWQLNVHDHPEPSDPGGWGYVHDEAGALTDLGKKIGNAYIAPSPRIPHVPTTYFTGEGKFLVHASVLCILSVSFEFDYIFASAS